jgi:hypothetical protein
MNPLDQIEDDEPDCYDERGNYSEYGMYDAGGHLIIERWIDYADEIHDRMKYKE